MDNRTEKMRSSLFNAKKQDAWASESIRVENTIQKMFESKQSNLIDIYDYARNERRQIAIDHDTDNKNDFGKIRTENSGDRYTSNEFAGGAANLPALNTMKNILLAQDELIKNPTLQRVNVYLLEQAFPDSDIGQYIIWRDPNAKARTIQQQVENISVRITIAKKNNPEDELSDSTNLPETIQIEVLYGNMNSEIYDKKLKEINNLLVELKNPACTGIFALKKLGILAYELSNLVPLARGSAAVNGWIIRGIAKAKGFDLGVMKVLDLPYDICAMIYKNKDHYAEQFAESMVKSFNLGIDIHFDENRNMIKKFLANSIDQLNMFKEKNPQDKAIPLINSLHNFFVNMENKINYLKLNVEPSVLAKYVSETLTKIPPDSLSKEMMDQLISNLGSINKETIRSGYNQNSFFHLPERVKVKPPLAHPLADPQSASTLDNPDIKQKPSRR